MNDISSNQLDSFLQSDNWSKIQTILGYQTEKIGDTYFYGRPHSFYGPRTTAGVGEINELLTKHRVWWLRLEPLDEITKYQPLGRIRRTIDQQPAQTLVLDLSLGENGILAQMHQKTRYNIRLAEKKGIEIISGLEYLDDFWRLMKQTTNRDGFRSHSLNYYSALLKPDNFIKLIVARYQGQIIAAGLFCSYGNTVTYLHGASDNSFRQVMAPYLLQWTVIKQAISEDYNYYDFYGISATKWPGVTRFKLGFGGVVVNYPGTFDVIIRPLAYFVYSLLRRLRRLI